MQLTFFEPLGLWIDLRTGSATADPSRIEKALEELKTLERGEIANPDEQRMVGHYWLRAPNLAPVTELSDAISSTIDRIKNFTSAVRSRKIKPSSAASFKTVLLCGIGGQMLGPQLLCDAFRQVGEKINFAFIDNTDPDGIRRILAQIGKPHGVMTVVSSKSGTTPETLNGALIVREWYSAHGVNFAEHAVAISCEGSALWKQSVEEQWLDRFPMWDWVGGRTSITSSAGLLFAGLLGVDISQFLNGAAAADQLGRENDTTKNPALHFALAWYAATEGVAKRAMVVIPYSDRLSLLGRYFQQLVMESLGKAVDREGKAAHQGLTVFGNKGSTDQHSYVQQLREGPDDNFVVLINVLADESTSSIKQQNDLPWVSAFEVQPGVTTGDYLHAFLVGTREALTAAGRQTITLTINEVSPFSMGALIALFERAVSFYASLINVNAYNQPGVEAGKKAAANLLELKRKVDQVVREITKPFTAGEIARLCAAGDRQEQVYFLLERLVAKENLTAKRNTADIFATQFAKHQS